MAQARGRHADPLADDPFDTKPVVVGIDPSSTKIAVVAIDTASEEVMYLGRHSMKGTLQARLVAGFRATEVMISTVIERGGEIQCAYIEQAVFIKRVGAKSFAPQAKMAGVIELAFMLAGVPVIEVPPPTWKKQVVGKGNASKDEVADWLRATRINLHGRVSGDQDLIDAAAIACHGIEVQRRGGVLL